MFGCDFNEWPQRFNWVTVLLVKLLLNFHNWQEEMRKEDENHCCVTSWLLGQQWTTGIVCVCVCVPLNLHWDSTHCCWPGKHRGRRTDRHGHILLVAWRDVQSLTWKWSQRDWTFLLGWTCVMKKGNWDTFLYLCTIYNEQGCKSSSSSYQ